MEPTERPYDYGDVLVITTGRYKGTIAIYDNDEGEDEMILYPGPVGISGYIIAHPNKVRLANDIERARYNRECRLLIEAYRNARP